MSDNQSKRQHGIESLVAERKKFAAWLTQLDARRESTAEHVFARVHADYAKRLGGVRDQLAAEADGIRAIAADLEARLATEQRMVTEKSDERAELELRVTVGEFSEKEWTGMRPKLDSALGELRAARETTERDLADWREILRSAASAPAAGAVPDLPVEPVNVARDESPAPPPMLGSAKSRARTPYDELAFLKSVAGTPTMPTLVAEIPALPMEQEPKPEDVEPQPEAELAVAPQPEAELAVAPAPVFAEPSARDAELQSEAVAEPASEALFDMTPEPVFERDSEPEEASVRSRGSSRMSVSDDSPLGAPTPRTSQAIRSLKCGECGTLNFPTEWYCERCGGELAAF